MEIFNDLRPIPGSEAFGGGRGGGGGLAYRYRLCDTPNEAKYLLKKSDRRCTFTQLANKKYDSVTFSIRITFEQVSKQRLKVKNTIKRLLNAIF